MANIYALCDRTLLERFGLRIDDFVEIAKRFDASIIQYRDKESTLDEKQEYLKRLRALWEGTLIVNDDFSLARYCDGVHIGQEDLLAIMKQVEAKSKGEAVRILKKLIGKKIIGLSTHNLAEIEEANSWELDYIGLGAYRPTSTKDVTNILGDTLFNLAIHSKHPVVAIGGVRVFDQMPGVWLKAVGSDLCIKALTYA